MQRVTGVAPAVLDHYRRTILPTESLPHTVLYADETLRLSGNTRRYTNWATGAAHPKLPVHIYAGAGHGFSCDERGSFHKASHEQARERTIAFFREHLG